MIVDGIMRWIINRSVVFYLALALVCAMGVNFKETQRQRSRYLLGVFYNENLSNYNDGIVYFDYLTRVKPQESRNYFLLGYCYLFLGQYDKALIFIERAVKMSPEEKIYTNYLAHVKSRLNPSLPVVELPADRIQIPVE